MIRPYSLPVRFPDEVRAAWIAGREFFLFTPAPVVDAEGNIVGRASIPEPPGHELLGIREPVYALAALEESAWFEPKWGYTHTLPVTVDMTGDGPMRVVSFGPVEVRVARWVNKQKEAT